MDMTSSQTIERFVPRNYDIFSGLDVDKAKIAVNFFDHEKSVKSMQIPNDADNLLGYVRKNFAGQKVAFAYEAGPTGYGLHDRLVGAGFTCLVVAPSMVPTPPGKHVKTNRLDSRKLADSLRGGQLQGIRVPGAGYRELRHLVSLRDGLVRQGQAAKCRIKSLLLFESIPFPAGNEWSLEIVKQLKELSCNPAVRFKLDSLLANLDFAHQQVLKTTREIRRFCTQDAELKRCIEFLISVPGVGWIVASHLLARIGDWRHLHNVRELASFLGLTQREDSTGDSVRRGSITRAGDSRLRNKLIQSAWVAIRRDPELREFYRRIYERHPKDQAAKKAIVAVARKMTMRIHAVLYEQRPYIIRHEISSDPLIQEETVCPRGRPDGNQSQENPGSSDGSHSETGTPGRFFAAQEANVPPKKEAHLKTV